MTADAHEPPMNLHCSGASMTADAHEPPMNLLHLIHIGAHRALQHVSFTSALTERRYNPSHDAGYTFRIHVSRMSIVPIVVSMLSGFAAAEPASADFWVPDTAGRITHACNGTEPVVLCMQGRKVVMQVRTDNTNGFSYKARFFNVRPGLVNTKQITFDAGRESLPEVRVNGQLLAIGVPAAVGFDGMLTLTYPVSAGVVVTRTIYPSMAQAMVIDEWQLRNAGDKPVAVTVAPARSVKPAADDIAIVWSCQGLATTSLDPAGVAAFASCVQATPVAGPELVLDVAAEHAARRAMAEAAWRGPGRLETPEAALDVAFALQKFHVLESPIETTQGVITHNGSLTYSPGIWANDPVEYSSPLFPFFGDAGLNRACMNMYRVWQNHCQKNGIVPFPGSFEGDALKLTQRERGDDAMVLYGLSKFLLFQGDRAAAAELWPLIEFSAASVLKHTTADGIIASQTDEMEDRYPTGNANLSTSALAYGGYRQAASLARALGKPVAAEFDQRADALRKAIDAYFGADIEGFNTYRYYKDNTTLRGWILLPLAMGINERKDGTVAALLSDKLWPKRAEGADILAESTRPTEWGRETYYALRALFKAGRTEEALDLTRRVVAAQIFGRKGPYPDEDAIDMLCPGSLYPRVFTEGLFGIVPTGLDSFECTPWLPKDWPRMALRDLRAFGHAWDIVVERDGGEQKVTVSSNGQTLMSGSGPAGKSYAVTFARQADAVAPPPVSTIKDYGLKDYVRLSKDLPHAESKPWKLVCTMPYNCHFQPWIEVESPAGKELRFNSSNPLVLYLTPTETATTLAGTPVYEAKNWVSGEGAIYTIPAGVTVKAVKYRETGYDTTFAGSFECNDEDYNILWKKAARTAYVCMRERFYDCPDRERVGFWGDGTPELNQCFYVFDSASHRLAKELVLRKLEPKFYPGQHLEFLGEYGLWFYYMHTGDVESMRAVYDQTKTFLLQTYQFGNPRTWFDWGKEIKDTTIIETCFHYIDLKSLKQMALVTGHEADVAMIDEKLSAIQSTFDSRFWKGEYYMSKDVYSPDDRANAMAVNAGLADRSKWESIYQTVLTTRMNSSNFFDRWVFEALCTMGRQEYALLRMAQRYKTMIPCSFTTLWEVYDRWWASRTDAFEDGSSLNHGWNPPALILSQNIAGVSPVAPGWSTYQVMPREAFLTSLKVVVPTIKGNVTVDLNKTAAEYALTLTSPAATTAIVGIPKNSFSRLDSIAVNGTPIWPAAQAEPKNADGNTPPRVEGVTWHGEDSEYVKFRVAPGTWKFVGRGSLPLTSPKPLPTPVPNDIALDKKKWTASACVPDGSYLFSGDKIPVEVPAANALDGDHWTGWRDMTRLQHAGQWFQVDMQQVQSFDKIVLDNTWALWDSPDRYAVSVSADGIHWGEPIATGAGQLGITTITFPLQHARHLRITQTGMNALYHWSIYELDVYRQSPATHQR
jgi:hypothetical protein